MQVAGLSDSVWKLASFLGITELDKLVLARPTFNLSRTPGFAGALEEVLSNWYPPARPHYSANNLRERSDATRANKVTDWKES